MMTEQMTFPTEQPSAKNPKRLSILIQTNLNFFERLWVLISNPLRYLFTGKLKY
jgi:hypothetical protein